MVDLGRGWTPVEVRVRVAAPPAEVYAVISDPETYPDWLVGAQRIRHVDPDFPRPGSEFHHTVGVGGPLTVDDSTEVVDVEPLHRLELEVHAGVVHGDVELVLFPDPAGTTVCFRERPTGWAAPLTPLLRPLLYVRNSGSLRNLERFLADSGSGPPAAARPSEP